MPLAWPVCVLFLREGQLSGEWWLTPALASAVFQGIPVVCTAGGDALAVSSAAVGPLPLRAQGSGACVITEMMSAARLCPPHLRCQMVL